MNVQAPAGSRYPDLRGFLQRAATDLRRLPRHWPAPSQGEALSFASACRPFLGVVGRDLSAEMIEQRMRFVVSRGFPGDSYANDLNAILETDTHLRECCALPIILAELFDEFVLGRSHESLPGAPIPDEIFLQFENEVYAKGPFEAVALTHLYNFRIGADRFVVEGQLEIGRLPGPSIALVLGEPTPDPALHSPAAGEFFIGESRRGPCPDPHGLAVEARSKAINLIRVMQYLKEGVVDAGFSTVYFLPDWVNRLRRRGISFLGHAGRPAHLGGQRLFELSADELGEVQRRWMAFNFPEVQEKLFSERAMRNPMRQALLRAGDYFESSHTRQKGPERLLDLAIALESLFSPGDQSELKHRICINAAQLCGGSAADRTTLFLGLDDFYKRRSKLVHGSYDTSEYAGGSFVTVEELDRWAGIVRRSALGFLAAYYRGEDNPKDFRKRLDLAALDPDEAERIRATADFGSVLGEVIGRAAGV